jgi:hypothetical protein
MLRTIIGCAPYAVDERWARALLDTLDCILRRRLARKKVTG